MIVEEDIMTKDEELVERAKAAYRAAIGPYTNTKERRNARVAAWDLSLCRWAESPHLRERGLEVMRAIDEELARQAQYNR